MLRIAQDSPKLVVVEIQAVIAIRGFIFVSETSLSAGFSYKSLQINIRHNSAPLLSAVLVFAGFYQNKVPANDKFRL